MSYEPTTVTKLEVALYKAGHRSDGVIELSPDANDEGHQWYPDFMTMMFGKLGDTTSVDFFERHTEDKVEMSTSLTPEQLVRVADVFAKTHKSTRHQIHVNAIVTVTTAVAVCDAISKGKGKA